MQRIRQFLPVLLAIVLSTAAARGDDVRRVHADAGGTIERQLQHSGYERTWLLHLPEGFRVGDTVPLVIALHGLSMNGRSMETITGFSDLADEKQFAVVYPDGLNRMWRFWERHELGPKVRQESGYVDDVGFIATIIDTLEAEGIIDPQRVYVTGLSNGAYMTNRLACALGNRIAAIAPVAGTMSPGLAILNPPRPIPVLYIHGTDDRIVGFNGVDGLTRTKSSLEAKELVRWWTEQNACKSEGRLERLPDVADDRCLVVRHTYEGDAAAPVVFYEIEGGGHTWPDGRRQPERFLGPVCRDFSACRTMWEFFCRFELPDERPELQAAGQQHETAPVPKAAGSANQLPIPAESGDRGS